MQGYGRLTPTSITSRVRSIKWGALQVKSTQNLRFISIENQSFTMFHRKLLWSFRLSAIRADFLRIFGAMSLMIVAQTIHRYWVKSPHGGHRCGNASVVL